jgi:hypothetical protein
MSDITKEAEVFLDNLDFWFATLITLVFLGFVLVAGDASCHHSKMTFIQILQIGGGLLAIWLIIFFTLRYCFYLADKEEGERMKKFQEDLKKMFEDSRSQRESQST